MQTAHGVTMDNFWKNKNVLVTGINGFVGSSVARNLISQGANVTGIVKDINAAHSDLLQRCNIAIGDITSYNFLCNVISSNEIDVIYHLAAYSIVRISANDPLNTYNVNVMGTVNLLEAARNVGRCTNIVVASSDKAYGDHDILPYTEEFALQPKNTYDTSKACMDMISRSYAHNYNMPISVSRCSNIYGPGDMNLSRLIPNTIRLVLNNKRPMLYNDIENMEREFIFIDDVVWAYDLVGRDPNALKGMAFNIGGTGPKKIRDVVDSICKLIGKPDIEMDIVKRDSAFKEISKQHIDATLLNKKTGWIPLVGLDNGLDLTIQWYKKLLLGV